MARSLRRAVKILAVTCVVLIAVPAFANHGPPPRSPNDPCNGTAAFNTDNVVTREVVDMIASQNGGSTTNATHALLPASGHVALQVRETTVPLSEVEFRFAPTDSGWSRDSTNHPGYLTAIEANENATRDADGDLVLGKTFVFFIPTDVVPDGNYVAQLRAIGADGSTVVGTVCVDSIVSNGQGLQQALDANRVAAYEPIESTAADVGFKPQPVAWFPAAEPSAAQQAGYGTRVLRVEFVEQLSAVKVEREEVDPLNPALKIWVDHTARLVPDDFSRPHFLAGGRMDETPLEGFANQKVWGPGYKFSFDGLPSLALPNERLRVTATDVAGKTFCGIYTFSSGPNGSFLVGGPTAC
jgi:hypothetical protein